VPNQSNLIVIGGTRIGVKTLCIDVATVNTTTNILWTPKIATNKGIHRSTEGRKAGRKIAAQSAPLNMGLAMLTKEQLAWNAAIDAKRLARKSRKESK
jgi:hypothetical protein